MQNKQKDKFQITQRDIEIIEKYWPTKVGYPHKPAKKKAHKAG